MNRRDRISACALGLLLVTGSWPVSGRGEPSQAPQAEAVLAQRPSLPGAGLSAPAFQLRDLNGKPVSLSSYRGKVVLINFWATWCGPCRVEMPSMERLYRQFKTKGFEVLAVSTDAQGAAVTRPFTAALGLTFPVLHDSDFRVAASYGVRALPMSFIIDRRGVIAYLMGAPAIIPGARDWQAPETKESIQSLLSAR